MEKKISLRAWMEREDMGGSCDRAIDLAIEKGWTICNHGTPLEAADEDIDSDLAKEICTDDPGLIYLTKEAIEAEVVNGFPTLKWINGIEVRSSQDERLEIDIPANNAAGMERLYIEVEIDDDGKLRGFLISDHNDRFHQVLLATE